LATIDYSGKLKATLLDAFTHGTSAQRTRWFLAGLKSGQVASLRHLSRRADLKKLQS
jgi:predicted metalloprotease